jgi:hypothetical protein
MAHQNSGWGYDRIVARSPTWVITWPTRQSAKSCGDTASSRPQKKPKHDLERVHRVSHGSFWPGSISSPSKCSPWGLVTYYVLFFIHVESRRVSLAGITRHPARPGWSRWRATQRPRVGVTWSAGAMRSTIGARSSAPRFGRHWRRVESERTDYWRATPQIVRNGNRK